MERLEDRTTPATFVVSNTADAGPGSLRDAIAQAMADGNPDTIVFDPSLAGAAINPSTVGDSSDGNSAYLITTPVTIEGTGQTLLRAAAAPDMRLFMVRPTGDLTLEDLTLRNGLAAGGNTASGGGSTGAGGAIYNRGKLTVTGCTFQGNVAEGGSVTPTGSLGAPGDNSGGGGGGFTSGGAAPTGGAAAQPFVSRAFTPANAGYTAGGGSGAFAPAVAGAAAVTGADNGSFPDGITESGGSGAEPFGITYGTTVTGPGGGTAVGGAVYNKGGVVVISDSTFTGNSAEGGSAFGAPGGYANGGAVYNIDGTMTLTNDTLVDDVVVGGTGGTPGTTAAPEVENVSYQLSGFPDSATLTIANTILADTAFTGNPQLVNDALTGTATVNATGPNIVSLNAENLGTMTGTAFTTADPKLGPLRANGGPTRTMAPQTGSPAVDAGSNTAASAAGLTTDQRGGSFVRVYDGTVDVGAFEVQPGLPTSPPPVLVVSGPADGRAQVYPAGAAGQYGSAAATVAPFGDIGADVRTAVADVNGDGVPDTILVTGPGTPLRVAVVSGADDATLLVPPFDPFGGNFTGGGFVAAADFSGTGRAEFVITPDVGGGPRVGVFALGTDGSVVPVADFFGINDPAFRGGARAAVGDINGDGVPDLVIAAGFGGGPRVTVFDGKSLTSGDPAAMANFFVFSEDQDTLRNGVYVAAGDVDGDGFADLIVGGGPGGGPRVEVLSGQWIAAGYVSSAEIDPIANFFVAGNTTDRSGVRVAAVDADGDGLTDVAAATGQGDAGLVRVYAGKDLTTGGEPTTYQDITPYGSGALTDGVYVGSLDAIG